MYQKEYASGRPQMYDKRSRKLKALNIVKILSNAIGRNNLKKSNVLDVGASSGIIDSIVSKNTKTLIGIDIDESAIKYAKKTFKQKNLKFKVGDALNLEFKENYFDVVICTHVYEHVESPEKLFKEIYKVLNRDGVCYLAAVNALWPIEPHYYLPFLSYLPKKFSNLYLKLFTGKDHYYETLLTYWGLKKVITKCKFNIDDQTINVLTNPKRYGFKHKPIHKIIATPLKYLTPTFFWILRK